MLVDVPPAVIKTFLQEGGMPAAMSQQCTIEPVAEGSLAVTYKIQSPSGVYYLKLHEAEGARGGPFLKHLLPLNDWQMREHAEKRRHFIRKMLDSVIAQRSTLVPAPCYFDLRPFPMALQKLRRLNDQVMAESRMEGEIYPVRLAGMVGTLWKELDIEHIPTLSPEKKDVWNPIDYSAENVFRCTAAVGEFQNKAEQFLDAAIQRKIEAGKGSKEQIWGKLCNKLQHEQRSLRNYDLLVQDFLSSLGLQTLENPIADLQLFGEQLLQRIEVRVSDLQGASIQELQTRFLADVSIPAQFAQLPFQKLLFTAERERWWTPAKRWEGKALDQLQQAETIAKELIRDPTRILSLVQEVLNFKNTYSHLEKLSQSIVPQDTHPFNLFIHRADGEISMLDLEDLSIGVRFADLSAVYVFKILQGFLNKKITEERAVELLKAAINGYNSTASSPLTQEELTLMTEYARGVFLNFLPQFGIILRLDPHELDTYLAFSEVFSPAKNSGLKHIQDDHLRKFDLLDWQVENYFLVQFVLFVEKKNLVVLERTLHTYFLIHKNGQV